jgi:hypothetical protein
MVRAALAFLLAAASLALPVHAFPIFGSPSTIPVVEYYNTILDHYFLTATSQEMYDIEHGSAGPGWTRTGWIFSAYPVGQTDAGFSPGCPGSCGTPVARFYGTPGLGPNSHFYTADAAEAAGLKKPGSGWTFERDEFQIPLPTGTDGAGACTIGVPVYRLYNNGFARHIDSNHRYVTDAGERAKMQAKGWIDEGVRFCAYGAGWAPINIFAPKFGTLARQVMTGARCEDETVNVGSCVAINNLTVPTTQGSYNSIGLPRLPDAFFDRTGMNSALEVMSYGGADPWNDVFVGADADSVLGIHLDTRNRGAANLSSVNPLFQLTTTAPSAGQRDQRFFPWKWGDAAPELNIQFSLFVKTLNVRSAGGAAYGHPSLEFMDTVSGHHFLFNVLAYSSQPIDANDFRGTDATTGEAIVGTTFRPQTPYGRSLALQTLPTPSGFVAPNPWGWGGFFAFRVNHVEFQRILDAARTIDPALSADPTVYLLDIFRFKNEVAGDGEIGLNLSGFRLDVLPPVLN